MKTSFATRRFASIAFVIAALAAQLVAPAAEAAPAPPNPIYKQPCLACVQFKPDLYLSSMYQRDAAGNSISVASAGQTVVYPITVGNQGILMASGVRAWWQADTSSFSGQGWQLVSATADSGFTCYVPAEYTGFQVYCIDGLIGGGDVAHITLTLRAPTTPGQHKIGLRLDPYNEIAELNETNNDNCCLNLWT